MNYQLTTLRTTSNDPLFTKLFDQLEFELELMYPSVQEEYKQFNLYDEPINVILLFHNGQAVGCGAFNRLRKTNWAELKRIFILQQFRGRGYSEILINALEKWASELHYDSCVLETGIRMHAAMSAYRKMAYQIVPNFQPYLDKPHSICMRKKLASVV